MQTPPSRPIPGRPVGGSPPATPTTPSRVSSLAGSGSYKLPPVTPKLRPAGPTPPTPTQTPARPGANPTGGAPPPPQQPKPAHRGTASVGSSKPPPPQTNGDSNTNGHPSHPPTQLPAAPGRRRNTNEGLPPNGKPPPGKSPLGNPPTNTSSSRQPAITSAPRPQVPAKDLPPAPSPRDLPSSDDSPPTPPPRETHSADEHTPPQPAPRDRPVEEAPPPPVPRDIPVAQNHSNNHSTENTNEDEANAWDEGGAGGADATNEPEEGYGEGGEAYYGDGAEGGNEDWGEHHDDTGNYDNPSTFKKPLPPPPRPNPSQAPAPPPKPIPVPPRPSVPSPVNLTSPRNTATAPPPTVSPPATPSSPRAPTAPPATSSATTTSTPTPSAGGSGGTATHVSSRLTKAFRWKGLMSKDDKGEKSNSAPAATAPASYNNNSSAPSSVTSPRGELNPIFGVPLAEAARLSDKVNGLVPLPVTKVIQWFAENGYDEEGLYRRSGSVTAMQKYIDDFNRGIEVKFPKDEHPINVAGVLKSFLLKLPDPLFTNDYRGQFGKLCTIKEQSMRIATLQFLLSKIPLVNRETIREISKHMYQITLYEEKNKMNPSNLGTSMGATWSAVMPTLCEAVELGVFPPETVVFGVPLEESLKRSDFEGHGEPAPFRVCYGYLKSYANVPYLYKAPVDKNLFHQVVEAFNSGTEVSVEGGDPLIVGEVFKHYFKCLPGSIFTENLYPKFISVKDLAHDEGLARLKGLMWELPELNFSIIRKLVDHFWEISQHFTDSKMTALDIATEWGEVWVITIDHFIECYDELFNQ